VEENRVTIDVLLATYNGAKHLESLLVSLVNQKGVQIHLIVGDDGSSDNTLGILNRYSEKFDSFRLYKFNRIGPRDNFLNLLNYSKNKYVAFCDQDDIWNEFHLKNSVQRIENSTNPICLTYSQVAEFEVENELLEVWPSFNKNELVQILVENPARGCTIVFSESLRDLAKIQLPSYAIMHDWWLLIVAWTCGEVVFEESMEVWYRLHESNHIGKGKKGTLETLRNFNRGFWTPLIQAEEILYAFGKMMHPSAARDLGNFVIKINSSFIDRVTFLKGRKTRMRSSKLGDVKLRAGIILFPVLFRMQKKYRSSLNWQSAK
jgi:glycosyltransferase involved in cell wall biosynthesis